MHLLSAHLFIRMHSFHVDNAVKDLPTLEAKDPEAEYQEQLEQEFMVADQVASQVSDQDYTNSDPQQCKPRCI